LEKILVSELLTAVKGKLISGIPENYILNISTDSRTIKTGDFFLPLQGEKFDGHNFIPEAIVKGAVGTLVEKGRSIPQEKKNNFMIIEVKNTLEALQNLARYIRKKFNPLVIAITGSNGKTTTKEMLGNILQKNAPTLVNYANWNNQIGLPLTLLQLKPEHRYCILEMGTNHPGEIASLAKIAEPQIGIITNIGKTHLQFFETVDRVLKEKTSLAKFLSSDGEIIYNADDPLLNKFPFSLRKTGFAIIEEGVSVRASRIKERSDGNDFFLHFNQEKEKIFLPLPGRFNVYNALSAAACAWRTNVDPETIIHQLETFSSLPQRMGIIRLPSGAVLLDDCYNANPDSMREAIDSFFKLFPDKEKILVLGDMLELGEKSKEEHYALGKYIALSAVESVFLYGKEILALAKGIRENNGTQEIYIFDEKNELTKKLGNYLQPGKAIFFKASRLMKLEEVVENLIRENS